MTARSLPVMTESELQSAVIELATLQGWMVTHFRAARLRDDRWATPLQGHPGFVDLVLARNGRALFFEVKTEKGKLTLDQERWRLALDACELEADDWDYLLSEIPDMGYAVIRPARWMSGQVERVLR